MKKLWCLVPLSILLGGCAAASYQKGAAPGGQAPSGRWDDVMMLAPHSVVEVLMADGAVARGLVAGVSTGSLRVLADSGDMHLPATDVMRVDRLEGLAPGKVRDGVVGAAWGVGVVAFVGLVLRRIPPWQWMAAAAMFGANMGVQVGRKTPNRVTIYLSPAIAPR